jgi:hypothetical protein
MPAGTPASRFANRRTTPKAPIEPTIKPVGSARTGDDGRFSIVALPPDRRYRATVVEFVEDGDLEDTEFLQRLRDGAANFSLDAGATEQLSLSLPGR